MVDAMNKRNSAPVAHDPIEAGLSWADDRILLNDWLHGIHHPCRHPDPHLRYL